jgi:GNAT superfamily N-acetyltransferase
MSNVLTPSNSHSSGPSSTTDGVGDERHVMLRGNDRVLLRPLHAQGIGAGCRIIEGHSRSSRRFRFLETVRSPSDRLLKQLTFINPSTGAAYVAMTGKGSGERQIGVARFTAGPGAHDCEFAVAVREEWQKKGLGTLLVRRLFESARARGIQTMHSCAAADNELMRKFAKHLRLEQMTDPQNSALMLYRFDLRLV